MTGSAVPEQQGAETDVVIGVDSTGEGGASPESTTAVPETATNTGSPVPEETVGVTEVSPEEEDVQSPPEAGPHRLGVKGVPAGGTGATGKLKLHVCCGVGLHVETETCIRPNLHPS